MFKLNLIVIVLALLLVVRKVDGHRRSSLTGALNELTGEHSSKKINREQCDIREFTYIGWLLKCQKFQAFRFALYLTCIFGFATATWWFAPAHPMAMAIERHKKRKAGKEKDEEEKDETPQVPKSRKGEVKGPKVVKDTMRERSQLPKSIIHASKSQVGEAPPKSMPSLPSLSRSGTGSMAKFPPTAPKSTLQPPPGFSYPPGKTPSVTSTSLAPPPGMQKSSIGTSDSKSSLSPSTVGASGFFPSTIHSAISMFTPSTLGASLRPIGSPSKASLAPTESPSKASFAPTGSPSKASFAPTGSPSKASLAPNSVTPKIAVKLPVKSYVAPAVIAPIKSPAPISTSLAPKSSISAQAKSPAVGFPKNVKGQAGGKQ